MCALVILGVSIARVYYKNMNISVDPRIRDARLLYDKYNDFAQSGNFDSVFWLMDTIESIYNQFPHYQGSYEVGVLLNNRAATYLTIALHHDNVKENTPLQDSLIHLAKKNSVKSIEIYHHWLNKYQGKTNEGIISAIRDSFVIGFEKLTPELRDKYLNKRAKEIEESLLETERRLSVSYTNLGVINRYGQEYELAARNYKKALELWNRNLTAENNLNKLLGRPVKKRNFIQKLFPPEKEGK